MTTSLPRIKPNTPILITPEPLLPSTFSPFGTAILPSLPSHLTTIPSTPPTPLHPPHQPTLVSANQNTALKTSPISPLTNNYPTEPQSKGQMSIFSCFPRQNTYLDPKSGKLRLRVDILERHPYTTQTFCPLNFSSSRSRSGGVVDVAATTTTPTYFVVVVAPSKRNEPGSKSESESSVTNPPDLSRLRAFLAPVTVDGGTGMAVTYAPGTWHAPMVVVGGRRVDFLVSQFVNGVPDDDCQEVLVGGGSDGVEEMGERKGDVLQVEVDLKGLGLGTGSDIEGGLWKAKL